VYWVDCEATKNSFTKENPGAWRKGSVRENVPDSSTSKQRLAVLQRPSDVILAGRTIGTMRGGGCNLIKLCGKTSQSGKTAPSCFHGKENRGWGKYLRNDRSRVPLIEGGKEVGGSA